MKKIVTTSLCCSLLMITALYSCGDGNNTQAPSDHTHTLSQAQLINKGRYLVRIGGCGDCHSPKNMTPQGPAEDTTLLLSGFQAGDTFTAPAPEVLQQGNVFNHQNTAFAGPWGVSYAANITPDASGIGNWTFEQFDKAMREGKAKGLDGGRMLLPPMPWPNYRQMEEEDMKAIYAYLKSIKPVSNIVPVSQPPIGVPHP